jgi:hypothetical protein
MEDSILKSTKKILGIAPDYLVFDLDVITHINAAFSTLTQLGVGSASGFMIEDDEPKWDDFVANNNPMLNMCKTYVFLKVKSLFDPPSTSYHLDAMQAQLSEYEWRLNQLSELTSS